MSEIVNDLKQLMSMGDCPCNSRAWAHWDETLSRACVRIAELEAVVGRLSKTADGVPVVPGDIMFHHAYREHRDRSRLLELVYRSGDRPIVRRPMLTANKRHMSGPFVWKCYSTPEGALAAGRSKKDGDE